MRHYILGAIAMVLGALPAVANSTAPAAATTSPVSVPTTTTSAALSNRQADIAKAEQYQAQAQTACQAHRYEEAIKFLGDAKQIYETAGKLEELVHCYKRIGQILKKKGDTEGAEQNSQMAANHFMQLAEKELQVGSLHAAGIGYKHSGHFYEDSQDQQSAISSFLEAAKTFALSAGQLQRSEQPQKVADEYILCGLMYDSANEREEAAKAYLAAAQWHEKVKDKSKIVAQCYEKAAAAYGQVGNIAAALECESKVNTIKENLNEPASEKNSKAATPSPIAQ